jgi:hypothetical protein
MRRQYSKFWLFPFTIGRLDPHMERELFPMERQILAG